MTTLRTTVRLSAPGRQMLNQMATDSGMSQTAVMELAIRALVKLGGPLGGVGVRAVESDNRPSGRAEEEYPEEDPDNHTIIPGSTLSDTSKRVNGGLDTGVTPTSTLTLTSTSVPTPTPTPTRTRTHDKHGNRIKPLGRENCPIEGWMPFEYLDVVNGHPTTIKIWRTRRYCGCCGDRMDKEVFSTLPRRDDEDPEDVSHLPTTVTCSKCGRE